ncbi:hypothetical protein A2473_01530 [candidate division WWE3 bacterium RIFOXYC2_FULL_42_13]|uniref:PEGA domain protein n=2 Tax=Katanobacteria TaxID=422282 RepID=A0A0G1GTX3_UNCKA|nr:MAG: PEGA domain protein [candidate division WWE3 bacterium GW2011_GWB2_43_22]OGC59036.1 MAG: hypothetical protein A2245_01795 [candidate division WWE3 bacterium RIFOXYA2_FULL_43_12]OGC73684.1 MAG: hypothetical protein A2473_01530 [candidate division WWE3 bacterium RIFOXYC2_FULL_42_13]OGC75193.1 MAG: hypothetical protein A2547_02130 [candidate division WWE3 bacterium RIFOXYD2_FULL_43_10]
MSISTIASKEKSLPNAALYIIGIIGVGLIVYFGGYIITNADKLKSKSGINVEVSGESAEIYINDKFTSKTPYTSDDIASGSNKVTLKRGDRQYQTSINFLPREGDNIHYVGIVRDLGTSDTFSSGREFWFEKDTSGNILRVISEPSGAKVYIDNSEVGVTPFLSNNISNGDYELKVAIAGFEPQSSRITINKGYTLNTTFKLFPLPVPQKISAFEGSKNIYDLSSDNNVVTTSPQEWAKAVVYWNKSRGLNIEGTGENKESFFELFLSYKGDLFNAEGTPITTKEELSSIKSESKIAYLGGTVDGLGLSKEAKQTIETLLGTIATGKQAKIKATPTGWLRVRSEPSLNGTEITRVDTGGMYQVLEEQTGWVKIKVSGTSEGWVSADYVELVE